MRVKQYYKQVYYNEGFEKPDKADVTITLVKETTVSLVPNQVKVIELNYVAEQSVFQDRNPRNLTLMLNDDGKVCGVKF